MEMGHSWVEVEISNLESKKSTVVKAEEKITTFILCDNDNHLNISSWRK